MLSTVMLSALLMSTAAQLASPAPPTGTTPSMPSMPAGHAVKRSIAATMWPVEPSVSAGFLWSSVGIVPYAGLTAFVPIIPGLGPCVVVRGAASDTGRSSFVEGLVGIGPAWEGRLGDMRARISLVPAAIVSSVTSDTSSGIGTQPGLLVPVELGLPLGSGISFTGFIEPGVSTAVVTVADRQIDTGRDRLFVMIGAGLTFGGPVD